MNSLEEDQAGVKVGGTKNVKVFLKRKPSDIEEEEEVASQLFSSLITAKQYKEHHNKRDEKLSHSYLQILLKKHHHEAELLEQFNLSFLFIFLQTVLFPRGKFLSWNPKPLVTN